MNTENTASGVLGCLMSLYFLVSQIATIVFFIGYCTLIPFLRSYSSTVSCQKLKDCSGYSLYGDVCSPTYKV